MNISVSHVQLPESKFSKKKQEFALKLNNQKIWSKTDTTYKETDFKNENFFSVGFDMELLTNWHSSAFNGILDSTLLGKVRTFGAQNREGTAEYPHHQVADYHLKDLCFLAHYLMNTICKLSKDAESRILFAFALASFLQYHMVDINPFAEGNEFMGRFISKRVLDWISPIPFPMFKNQIAYTDCLNEARKEENPREAPKHLMKLLLDSAIDHYKEVNSKYSRISYDLLIGGTSVQELLEKCRAKNIEIRYESIEQIFNELKEGESIDIQQLDKKIRLLKIPTI